MRTNKEAAQNKILDLIASDGKMSVAEISRKIAVNHNLTSEYCNDLAEAQKLRKFYVKNTVFFDIPEQCMLSISLGYNLPAIRSIGRVIYGANTRG